MQQNQQSGQLQLSQVEQDQRKLDAEAARKQINTLISNLDFLNTNCQNGQHLIVNDNYKFIDKWIKPKSNKFIAQMKQFLYELDKTYAHKSTQIFYSNLQDKMNEFYSGYELLYQQYHAYEDRKDVLDSDSRKLKLLSKIIS